MRSLAYPPHLLALRKDPIYGGKFTRMTDEMPLEALQREWGLWETGERDAVNPKGFDQVLEDAYHVSTRPQPAHERGIPPRFPNNDGGGTLVSQLFEQEATKYLAGLLKRDTAIGLNTQLQKNFDMDASWFGNGQVNQDLRRRTLLMYRDELFKRLANLQSGEEVHRSDITGEKKNGSLLDDSQKTLLQFGVANLLRHIDLSLAEQNMDRFSPAIKAEIKGQTAQYYLDRIKEHDELLKNASDFTKEQLAKMNREIGESHTSALPIPSEVAYLSLPEGARKMLAEAHWLTPKEREELYFRPSLNAIHLAYEKHAKEKSESEPPSEYSSYFGKVSPEEREERIRSLYDQMKALVVSSDKKKTEFKNPELAADIRSENMPVGSRGAYLRL